MDTDAHDGTAEMDGHTHSHPVHGPGSLREIFETTIELYHE